jgi:ABC-type branched-subunit amino acid transport system ATPase component
MPAFETLIDVVELTLSFGRVLSLNAVSMTVGRGELLALIGPNGAGKTSRLNCINGFYRPDSGTIAFKEKDITRVPLHMRAHMGIAAYAYIMENGRVVLDGPSEKVRQNEDVKEFYLGLTGLGEKKSYPEVKHYKRRKRWLG